MNKLIATDRIVPSEYKELTCEEEVHNRVIIRNELGEILSDATNEVLLYGSLFTLGKLFSVSLPYKFPSVNEMLGVHSQESVTEFDGPRREERIMFFTAGLDGCGDTYGDIMKVKTYHNGSNNMIPFRRCPVAKDLPLDEQAKYGIKKEVGGYFEYYVKKFESDPIFKSEFKDTGVPITADILTKDLPPERVDQITNYILIKLKITKTELREYFKQVGGGIEKSRVNTISLCSGYIEYDEHGVPVIKGVRPITQYNFNTEPMDNSAKELFVEYYFYA